MCTGSKMAVGKLMRAGSSASSWCEQASYLQLNVMPTGSYHDASRQPNMMRTGRSAPTPKHLGPSAPTHLSICHSLSTLNTLVSVIPSSFPLHSLVYGRPVRTPDTDAHETLTITHARAHTRTQGCEFSYQMLISSNFILNYAPGERSLSLHPWALSCSKYHSVLCVCILAFISLASGDEQGGTEPRAIMMEARSRGLS